MIEIFAPSATSVLVAHVDVDEAAQGTGVVEHPGPDAGVVGLERGQHLRHRRAVRRDLTDTTGVGAEDGRDPDQCTHERYSFQKSTNAS
jgi:hypothetical protein